jgi:hypothetical protein
LHEPRTDAPELVASAISLEFENDLRSIYSRSRTADEVSREIAALRDKISARREAYEREYKRTSQIIESRFDQDVRKVFRRLRDELPDGLQQLDKDIAALVDGYLTSRAVTYRRTEVGGRVVFDVAPDADITAEVGEARRFASGDARGLNDAQSLNMTHPLVRAAITHAQLWSGGPIQLALTADGESDLVGLADKQGILAVARVDYEGFEPVQRIVVAAIVNGEPLDPSISQRLVRLRATGLCSPPIDFDGRLLDDLLSEAVFVDQRVVEEAEQRHFEQAIGQLERFVEDKILLCRRDRSSVADKLKSAWVRRDEVVGSTVRERVESEIRRLTERDEELEKRIGALESREDEVYRKWRDRYHDLRYQAPKVTRLFQTIFRVTPADLRTSC